MREWTERRNGLDEDGDFAKKLWGIPGNDVPQTCTLTQLSMMWVHSGFAHTAPSQRRLHDLREAEICRMGNLVAHVAHARVICLLNQHEKQNKNGETNITPYD